MVDAIGPPTGARLGWYPPLVGTKQPLAGLHPPQVEWWPEVCGVGSASIDNDTDTANIAKVLHTHNKNLMA